ncbi:MAG: putative metal-binding motif-containing protein [Deltaproteobacteria bacterium]|nr:putative metal-binding motif-containing protein [Deltaproteobacteria bacterium]
MTASTSPQTRFLTALLALALAQPACSTGKDKQPDAEDDAIEDVTDEDVAIEWGETCTEGEDCDDRVDCTADTCEYGWCVNTPVDEDCVDELQCNGDEVCHPRDGCVPGDHFIGCYDEDPCTMDICREPDDPTNLYSCDHPPLDRDGDGHYDDHCEGGTDCDDLDPDVFPFAGEWCFDEKDNDCDDLIDGADTADCTLSNDTCSSPKELPLGRTVEGFNIGAAGDVDSACDSSSNPDVVYSFTLTETSDVEISIMSRDGYFYVYGDIQTTCGDRTSSIFCDGDSNFRSCVTGLEAGTYYFIISSWEERAFDIRVDATAASGPMDGDTCSTAIDVSAGGTFMGDLYCAGDDHSICSRYSYARNKEMVYTFTTTEARDVSIRANCSRTSVYGSLLTDCEDPATSLDCGADFPFDRIYGALPAGTYYFMVEMYTPYDFTLNVEFDPPSSPPSNNTCSSPTDVSAGGTFRGSHVAATDDGDVSCLGTGYLDAAWVFTTTTTQDVLIELNGDAGYMVYFALQTICGIETSDIHCENRTPGSELFRSLAPGTYYILTESTYQGEFDLAVTFSAPTTACGGMTTISSSGTFTGDTTGLPEDFTTTCGGRALGSDVPYLLSLSETSDVLAEITSATWDTVMHLRTICDDPSSEIACDDDSYDGVRSSLDLTGLAAGDYILIVDGYGTWAYGAYTLEVTITPSGVDSADTPDD